MQQAHDTDPAQPVSPERLRRDVLAALTGWLLMPPAGAQTEASGFPERPMTLYCPWTAGGPTDLALRALADALMRTLPGKRIVIENKPGAGGALGAQLVATTAKPDGYTLTQTPLGVFRLPHMVKTTFNPVQDLSWIICVAGYQFGVTVRTDSKWRHWSELIAHAKSHPGRVSYASPGVGTSLHLTMEEIGQREGVQWIHVPFKGSADAYAALRGGQVDCLASSPQWAALEAGHIRVLNIWTDQRNPRSPDTPTLKELYGIVANSPWGIAGPRGMDPRIVRFLHDQIRKAMEDSAFQAALARVSQEVYYLSSEDYAAFARSALEKEGEVVARLNLKA
jgi:tripartite-type tricarboxylate transporter receptor subunit TctC